MRVECRKRQKEEEAARKRGGRGDRETGEHGQIQVVMNMNVGK